MAWLACCATTVAIALSAAAAEPSGYGRYHALVIGNDEYLVLPKLETAVRDATAVADVLTQRYGFDVRLLLNASRDEILNAVNDYRANLAEDDNLLIYYAGHGWLDRATNTGFWQPVDAVPDSDVNWIANEDLTRRLQAMLARHVLVVADSCYSGSLVRGGEAELDAGKPGVDWLLRLSEKRSRTAIVSGGLEPVADRGRDGHSVFANAFLTALRENSEIIEGTTLFQRIRRPVIVNADQTPQYADIRRAGHEGGEFIFVPLDAAGLPARVAKAGTPVPQSKPAGGDGRRTGDSAGKSVELLFWDSIKESKLASDYAAYLEKYPDGEFVPLAKSRIAALTQKPASPTLGQQVPGRWKTPVLTNPFDNGIHYWLEFAFEVAENQLIGSVVERSTPGSSRDFVVERGILDGVVGNDNISFRVPYEIAVKEPSGKERIEKHQKFFSGRLDGDRLLLVMQDDHGFPAEEFSAERIPATH